MLFCTNLVTPTQGEGQRKWYQMTEVNSGFKHGRYEHIWLKGLIILSKESFCHATRLAGQMKTTQYKVPSYGQTCRA